MDPAIQQSETILPRPVELLPTPALAPATRKLAEKLTGLYGMRASAASAFALAVVDPSTARRAAENPERLPIPGGIVLGVRAEVWSRLVLPDPRNPRIGPARRYPASNLVGSDESTRFRPLPEPETAESAPAELVERLQSQEHLAWAAQQARDYVLGQNDWRDSIRHQGVMTEVWLAATTFDHADGEQNVTIPVTAEGSSRLTAVHDLLGVRSADLLYSRDERKLRAHVRKLNAALEDAGAPEQVEEQTAVMLRCEKVPALLLVGFEPHGGTAADFAAAVKSLVALRHVDYPKPWGEATENESLADAVLDVLQRRGLITPRKADWLAGALSPAEAEAAGFSADATIRAAAIMRVFTDRDPDIYEAVRTAITSQSTRKRITTKFLLDVATSLVLRGVPEGDARKRERTRKYLKESFGLDLTKEWEATFRPAEELASLALAEAEGGTPGPASRELAARSAYPLVVEGHLTGDRGSVNSDQPDRRKPGEVIERMRTTQHGVHQLRQALTDFADGRKIRMVDESGTLLKSSDGRLVIARDANLRRTFYPAGAGPTPLPAPQTPAEVLNNALGDLGKAITAVRGAVRAVEDVRADDGTAAIDALGADRGDCDTWREILLLALDKLPVWKQRNIERTGYAPEDLDVDADDEALDEELLDEEAQLAF